MLILPHDRKRGRQARRKEGQGRTVAKGKGKGGIACLKCTRESTRSPLTPLHLISIDPAKSPSLPFFSISDWSSKSVFLLLLLLLLLFLAKLS
jgi:hypothetical protein